MINDRVSERSHRWVAPPCFLNVTVTVETMVAARGVTPASWRRRGADASTYLGAHHGVERWVRWTFA